MFTPVNKHGSPEFYPGKEKEKHLYTTNFGGSKCLFSGSRKRWYTGLY